MITPDCKVWYYTLVASADIYCDDDVVGVWTHTINSNIDTDDCVKSDEAKELIIEDVQTEIKKAVYDYEVKHNNRIVDIDNVKYDIHLCNL